MTLLNQDTTATPDSLSHGEHIAIARPRATAHYSERFDAALTLAAIVHAEAVRKGTAIPYLMHPVHVARLLERHGFGEDVVLAGLLHDVLEDADFGEGSLESALEATFPAGFNAVSRTALQKASETFIAETFGANVLHMVKDVTELKTESGEERPWRVRKDEQIAHINELGHDSAGLKAADALHNSRAILRDVRALGLPALKRFNCSVEELLWSYGTVAAVLRDRLESHPISAELDDAVFELTEAVNRLLESSGPQSRCMFCGNDHVVTAECSAPTTRWPMVTTVNGRPIRSLAHWRRLAPPVGGDRQWVTGRSAKEAARAWSQLSTPEDVLKSIRELPGLGAFTPVTVIPELVTELDDFGEGRHHDLIVFGVADGKRVLVGIEAKSDEELGPRIGGYLTEAEEGNIARQAAGRRLSSIPERIRLLTQLVFGDRTVDLSEHRYQLLHGVGGTLIEAAARGADVAVFMVHTFRSPVANGQRIERNKNDVARFIGLLRAIAADSEGALVAGANPRMPARMRFFVTACETSL